MKNMLAFSWSACFLLAFLACSNQGADFQKKLADLDKAMTGPNGVVIDLSKAGEYITTAEAYAASVKTSDPAKYGDLLSKAAALAKTVNNPNKAIELYKKVVDELPQHPKAPMSLFMLGFIYENDLVDLEKAKSYYQEFLNKYPNDPDFADDAQLAIQNLGKSPEEILKSFEEKEKAAGATPETAK